MILAGFTHIDPDHVQSVISGETSCRTRRIVRYVGIAAIAMISLAACSSGASDNPTAVDTSEPTLPTTAPPTPTEATATVGPGTGTGYFVGSAPEVPVTFTMPAGWESDGPFVSKSDAEPTRGLVFMNVSNLYADGCQWELVDPPPGPTVDDLASVYANLPELGATPARDVTVDGFEGKQIQITIPGYNENECKEGKFGIFQVEGINPAGDAAPNLWSQAPKQQNKLWILDVDGTRLVILAGYPPNISAQDRTDLDGILSTIQIG
jgi:hypothetical protein